MNRRTFIAGSAAGLLASAAGWLRAANAQPQNMPVIGLLDGAWGSRVVPEISRALRENGFLEGKHFRYAHSRWNGSELQVAQIAKHAAEFVERQVALIIAFSDKAALAAKSATSTTPVIFLANDPVAIGLVKDPDRPGGNLTGSAHLNSGLIAKRIEIARELVPATKLVFLVSDPGNTPAHDAEVREARSACEALGLELAIIAWTGEGGIEPELVTLPRDREAVLVFGDGLPFLVRSSYLAYMARLYGFAAVHGDRWATEDGGLASFGTRFGDGGYHMGVCVARVLRGERPGDMPVRQINGRELVINRWVAKSPRMPIPATLLARADEVID
jgi:putative ABC transport system substrate-binding protein